MRPDKRPFVTFISREDRARDPPLRDHAPDGLARAKAIIGLGKRIIERGEHKVVLALPTQASMMSDMGHERRRLFVRFRGEADIATHIPDALCHVRTQLLALQTPRAP